MKTQLDTTHKQGEMPYAEYYGYVLEFEELLEILYDKFGVKVTEIQIEWYDDNSGPAVKLFSDF